MVELKVEVRRVHADSIQIAGDFVDPGSHGVSFKCGDRAVRFLRGVDYQELSGA
jgi:hypothetical protein